MSNLTTVAGAAVGRACLYGSIFILVVWLICRFAPKLSDSARCGLWWLASVKLLLGLGLSASVAIPLLPALSPAETSNAAAVNRSASLDTAPLSKRLHPQQTSSGVNDSPTTSAPALADSQERPFSWPTLATALLWLWALAVVFRLGYLCRSLIVLKQCIARSSPLEDPALLGMAQEVARAFGISRIPRLCVSETVTDPLLCGLFHKVILFSASDVANLSPAEFRMVFAHECAHLRRGDLYLSLFPAIAQTVYCFFPPAWLVCSEFEATREAACDTAALNVLNAEPGVYGRLLLKLSSRPERLDPLSLAGALGVSSHLRLLRRRITMLQFSPSYSRRRALAGLFLVSACGVVGLVPWRVVAAKADGAAKSGRSLAQASSSPHGQTSTDVPLQPRNLDFSSGMAGWQKIEAVNEMPVETGDAEFTAEIAPNGPHPGVPALSLVCKSAKPTRDVVVDQKIRSDAYKGKRYRFSALVKTENTTAAAGIWIRQDATNGQRAWNAFSNPVLGTTEWKRYEYVLEVLPTSTELEFGAMLEGRGKLEVTDFRFEPVDRTVAISDPYFDSILPEVPINLNFAQGIKGWGESTHDGDEPYFASGLDPSTKRGVDPAPYLACNSDKRGVYGVLTQWIDAAPYRGKRVRFSGYVKTAAVREYGGLMWCLNGAADSESTYDMRKHAGKGDHDWTHEEFVADVPADRVSFTIGINLQGRGTVWMDGLKFEVVGDDVPLTPAYQTGSHDATGPQNLNFAQGLAHWSRGASGADSPNPYYEVGLDRSVSHNGSPAAYVKSSVPDPQGYGVLRQDVPAITFRGKRIRFSAYLKTKGVEKYSGLMLAIYGSSGNHLWSMSKHPLLGDTDWKRCEFVVDVPEGDSVIMFGASIQGRGTVYATDFKFEVVGNDVPVTEVDGTP